MSSPVRRAVAGDGQAIGRLLDASLRERGVDSPGADVLCERVRSLLAAEHVLVLLAGDGPDGVAALRFRPSLWSHALECYVATLYVEPEHRGRGLGRALMEESLACARSHGAHRLDVTTAEDATAARTLFERLGLGNRDAGPDGPARLVYEREL